ncbi:hypothetical protein PQX77_001799 [Marasmius sp. AFHP31]|nr:hypothetical protein PQX77_001799 [Marasmius sp. AFHP31]
MEEVQWLYRQKPDEKLTIHRCRLFSQWTGCLTLVSDYLPEYDVRHVKYQGNMTRVKREQALRVFMSKDNAPHHVDVDVVLGYGLNLTRGCTVVISLDLGWSQAIENQAFDRVRRLDIENTVFDRIMVLQERKQNLADGSLGEGNGKIGRPIKIPTDIAHLRLAIHRIRRTLHAHPSLFPAVPYATTYQHSALHPPGFVEHR